MKEESVKLWCYEGGSDKVYNIDLKEVPGSGWTVKFEYGRRGGGLNRGTKTNLPVSYPAAKKVFDKLINEKLSKGYQITAQASSTGTPVVTKSKPVGLVVGADTGFRPQLLNEVSEEDLEKLFKDKNWCAQEKYDGRRRLLIKTKDGDCVATNRKGLVVEMGDDLKKELDQLFNDVVLDGEDLGDNVVLFDVINKSGNYLDRLDHLTFLTGSIVGGKIILMAPTSFSEKEKRELFKDLKQKNAEGIVFKRLDKTYSPGRPASGGDMLKFKFVATASCVCIGGNLAGTSIALAVYDEKGEEVPVGNATVYPNQTCPKPGQVVEVKYLYYFAGGSLFQPVLLGTGDVSRDDILPEECIIKQLKLKQEVEL